MRDRKIYNNTLQGERGQTSHLKISVRAQACHCSSYIPSTWCSATAASKKLMNEQSSVILRMSLKVANCTNSFHHIRNFLTSISSLLTNFIQLATTASANWFPNIIFWIWKQNAGETLKRDLGKRKSQTTYPGTSPSCGFTNCKDGDILSSV